MTDRDRRDVQYQRLYEMQEARDWAADAAGQPDADEAQQALGTAVTAYLASF